MYEDFLEEFVYNTAKEIAMKLFGKFTKRRPKMKKTKTPADLQMEALLEHEKDLLAMPEPGAVQGEETADQRTERELHQLLKESVEKQKTETGKKSEEELKQREEYNGINEGLSPLHFHFTLFLFLVVLTLLNLPSAITWAKNFEHSQRTLDASTVPAVMTISALAVIWQMTTPRTMVKGYPILAMVFYGMAMVTIIYCLDSPFLLNNIIAMVFVLVALHQLFAPKLVILGLVEDDGEDDEEDKTEGGDDKEKEIEELEGQQNEEEEEDDEEEEDEKKTIKGGDEDEN